MLIPTGVSWFYSVNEIFFNFSEISKNLKNSKLPHPAECIEVYVACHYRAMYVGESRGEKVNRGSGSRLGSKNHQKRFFVLLNFGNGGKTDFRSRNSSFVICSGKASYDLNFPDFKFLAEMSIF